MAKQRLFEFTGSDVSVKAGHNFVSQKVINGTQGMTSVVEAFDGFSDIGINLLYDVDHFRNIDVSTNINTGATIIGGSGFASGSGTGAIDGLLAVNLILNQNGNITIDLGIGVQRTPAKWRIYTTGGDSRVESATLQGSNDNSNYTLLDTMTLTAVDGWHEREFPNIIGYRYYRVTNTGLNIIAGQANLNEVEIYEGFQAASINNEVNADLPVQIATQFDPGSLIIRDKNGLEVTSGTCNVMEVINDVVANSGVLVDYDIFKQRLNTTLSTNVKIRIQPVGTQTISEVRITSLSTKIEISDSTLVQSVAGVDGFRVNSNGSVELPGTSKSVNVISDSDYTMTSNDDFIVFADLTSDKILSLPPAVNFYNDVNSTSKQLDVFKKTALYSVQISGSEPINGSLSGSLIVNENECVSLYTDGLEWFSKTSHYIGNLDTHEADSSIHYTTETINISASQIIDLDTTTVENITTTETDDALVLKPNGVGGVVWTTDLSGSGETDLSGYSTTSEIAGLTGDLQTQIASNDGDLSGIRTDVDAISGKIFTDVERTKLSNIEDNATADQSDAEIEVAYNNQVGVVSQVDAEAGTSTLVKRWTPERVKQAVDTLAPLSITLGTNKVVRTDGSGNLTTSQEASDLLAGDALTSSGGQLDVAVDGTTISNTGTQLELSIIYQDKIDNRKLRVYDLDISAGGNFNIVDIIGLSPSYEDVIIRLTGVISANTTITMPTVNATIKRISIKDAFGNGLSSPDYTLRIIPSGGNGIDSSDITLTNIYELESDYEAVTFVSHNGSSKWESLSNQTENGNTIFKSVTLPYSTIESDSGKTLKLSGTGLLTLSKGLSSGHVIEAIVLDGQLKKTVNVDQTATAGILNSPGGPTGERVLSATTNSHFVFTHDTGNSYFGTGDFAKSSKIIVASLGVEVAEAANGVY